MTACVYTIALVLSALSIAAFVTSIASKSKSVLKCTAIVGAAYIVYLFIDLAILPSALDIEIGLEVVILYLIAFISGIIYIVSAVICLVKNAKNKEPQERSKKTPIAAAAFLAVPVLIVSCVLCHELLLIRSSDLILIYNSRGNGGIGDGENFAFAVSERRCEQFDTGIYISGYGFERFLPENAEKIKQVEELADYDVTLGDDHIIIYKNGEKLHEKPFRKDYFNIDFECGFVIE